MRILVHDYGGYAFPIELSRWLAAAGHEITHAYFATPSEPKGPLTPRAGEKVSLLPIAISKPFAKYKFVRRFIQEREYGALLGRAIVDRRPEVVLSGTTPLEAQQIALKATRIIGGKFVYWLQDLTGVGTRELLRDRFFGGALIGGHYERLENRLLEKSDAIISISDKFRPLLTRLQIPEGRVHVIPNWSAADISPREKANAFAIAQSLVDKFCFLYTGMLGLKHNPRLLVELAAHFSARPDVRVVVVSEGPGAAVILAEAAARGLRNLVVLPYQPFAAFPDLLGSADVLVAVLEPAAGAFSVPSKVLSYLRAERPIVLSVPADNDAAQLVTKVGAGLVTPPEEVSAFIAAAEKLYANPALRKKLGDAGGHYARAHFAIDRIGPLFESILVA